MGITSVSPQTVTVTGTGGGYLDVDCSVVTGYVAGTHANGVAIMSYVGDNNGVICIRRKGDTSTPAGSDTVLQPTNGMHHTVYCPLDANGKFEFRNGYSTLYDFTCVGFIAAADVHLFSAFEETNLTATTTFTNITPTASGGDTVYAAIGYMYSGGGGRLGVRPDGGTDEFQVIKALGGFIVPCVGGIFEGYSNTAGYSSWYIVYGYIKNGTDYVWNTNFPTLATTTGSGTWDEDNVVNASAISAFAHSYIGLSEADGTQGIRAGDSTATGSYLARPVESQHYWAPCDSSGRVDVATARASVVFRTVGYEKAAASSGEGALNSQSAGVSGSGVRHSVGSGTPASQSATTEGEGVKTGPSTGDGDAVSQAATVSGAGTRGVSDEGSTVEIQSQSATVVGTSALAHAGSGTPASQSATVVSIGSRASVGSGTPAAQSAGASGDGHIGEGITGEGALQSQSATVISFPADLVEGGHFGGMVATRAGRVQARKVKKRIREIVKTVVSVTLDEAGPESKPIERVSKARLAEIIEGATRVAGQEKSSLAGIENLEKAVEELVKERIKARRKELDSGELDNKNLAPEVIAALKVQDEEDAIMAIILTLIA